MDTCNIHLIGTPSYTPQRPQQQHDNKGVRGQRTSEVVAEESSVP